MKKVCSVLVVLFFSIAGIAFAQTTPAPLKSTVFQPAYTTPQDLYMHMKNEIDSRIANDTPSHSKKVMALGLSQNMTSARWNPNIWTNNGTPIDLTGIVIWSDYTPPTEGVNSHFWRGGALISPQHVIMATHNALERNKKVRFLTKDGQFVERTVRDRLSILPYGPMGPDVTVGVLDQPVPDTITHYPVLSQAEWQQAFRNEATDTFRGSLYNLPILYVDAEKKVSVSQAAKSNLYTVSTGINHGAQAEQSKRFSFNEPLKGGDSGHPMFVLVGAKPVLISSHTSPSGGPNYAYHYNKINEMMEKLGGGYKLSTINLSGFTSGASPARPSGVFAKDIVVTTDKTTYKIGDVVKMKARFTISPEWTAWLASEGKRQAELTFTIRDINAILIVKPLAFDITTGTKEITFDWQSPAGNPAFSGKRFTVHAGVTAYTVREAALELSNLRFDFANLPPIVSPIEVSFNTPTREVILTADDRDGDPLTFTPERLNLTYGTLTKIAEGRYTYALRTPLPTTSIRDEFTFSANDGTLNSPRPAKVTLNYTYVPQNTAPVTQPITVETNGTPVEINLTADDAERDAITFNTGQQPARGRVTRVAHGKYTYTPNTPLPATPYTDTFNYNATDGKLTSPATRVTVNYVPQLYTLVTSKTGNGTVMGIGINCGNECREELVGGSTHALNAETAMGYEFAGWSGACTGMGVCTVLMNQNQTVTANFVVKNTAPVAQNGTFTISSPATTANIILNASDAQNDTLRYTPSTLTTAKGILTRTAEGRYTYTLKTPLPTASFSETLTFTASDATLTSAPATITLNYTLIPPTMYTLTVSKVGLGTVTATGIDCGQDCQGDFVKDTTATLTATPVQGYTFTGWSGACTGPSCTVPMNATKAVTATFTQTNTAPTAQSAAYTAVANTVDITFIADDAQRDPVIFSLIGTPRYGTLTKLAEGRYRFTVTGRTNTADVTEVIEFTATDGKAVSNKATVTITITKTPSVPTTVTDSDGDGVLNAQDVCPRTPAVLKTEVNPVGCIKPRLSTFDIKPTLQNNLSNVTGFELGRSNFGKIKFKNAVNLSREAEQLDLDTNVRISEKEVEIKSANVPELNKPATVTLYNITAANPRILKDGVLCEAPNCVIDSYENGTLVFTVTGFSTYTVEDTPSTTTETTSEPVVEKKRRSGGGGGSSRTITTTTTTTTDNAELIKILTAQLNVLIAELNRLTGGSTTMSAGSFTADLSVGVSHADVVKLQRYLNSKGFIVATTGPGSPGRETTLYGAKTAAAVRKFQASKGISATGNVGPRTRAALNGI